MPVVVDVMYAARVAHDDYTPAVVEADNSDVPAVMPPARNNAHHARVPVVSVMFVPFVIPVLATVGKG